MKMKKFCVLFLSSLALLMILVQCKKDNSTTVDRKSVV